jgi:hypothetical protein
MGGDGDVCLLWPMCPVFPRRRSCRRCLLLSWAARLAEAYRVIGELTAQVGRMSAEVEDLRRRAGRDSSTSSRPPSSDSPYKEKGRERALRERGKRRPSKQPGEPEATMLLVDDPDERLEFPPAACSRSHPVARCRYTPTMEIRLTGRAYRRAPQRTGQSRPRDRDPRS